jgi:hypothetical protein
LAQRSYSRGRYARIVAGSLPGRPAELAYDGRRAYRDARR